MFRTFAAVLLALTFNAGPLHGQTFRGAIQGTVIDSSGSAIPKAEVTVIGEETNFTRQTFTEVPATISSRNFPWAHTESVPKRAVFKNRSSQAFK
jgi:hypothetical protein